MKKTDILNALGFLLAITSCGTASQYASNQQYQDGFYSRPSVAETKTATLAARSKVSELAEETRNSQIFLKAGETDTLYVPENMSTTLNFDKEQGLTSVTVTNTPAYSLYPDSWYWSNLYWNTWTRPYYSSWYWGANPWYYSSIYYDPWYWDSWYYDPWYWGRPGYYWSWYRDPWYYYHGWYCDPWHHHHYHTYYDHCWNTHGWYSGGNGKYINRTLTSRDAIRDGMGVASTSVRRTAAGTASRSNTAASAVSRSSGTSYSSATRVSRSTAATRGTLSSDRMAVSRGNAIGTAASRGTEIGRAHV